MHPQDFTADIPLETAIAAFNGTSFSPEVRGASYQADYARTLAGDYERLRAQAEKGGTLPLLDAEFARYRDGYRARMLAWLRSHGRIVSAFIVGGSNFPARMMQKRNDVEHKRLGELVAFRERALAAIGRTLRPDLAPIRAGDGNAVERLTAEIAKAEQAQEHMKAANAVIRKHRGADVETQVAALVEAGIAQERAYALLKPDFMGRVGFADYALKNNGAEIRRLRARLAAVQAAKAAPVAEAVNAAGVRLEDDPPANRVRLFFPGKPDEAVRARLKSGGFRWAPSVGAWQGYRNPRTMALAQAMVSEPAGVAA